MSYKGGELWFPTRATGGGLLLHLLGKIVFSIWTYIKKKYVLSLL